jgi:antitoxin component of MazEF toxin-antitoxin module
MELQIGKWGNGLALRLPSSLVKQAGLSEGSRVQAVVHANQELRVVKALIAPTKGARAKLADELRQLHRASPVGRSVVREMRDLG